MLLRILSPKLLRILTPIFLIALNLLLVGCTTKSQIIATNNPIAPEILFENEIVYYRDVKSQTDTALLLLDLSDALENCNFKLTELRGIYGGK